MSPANSHKQGRLNEEVRRALSQIITEVKDPRIPAMPTIVNVKVAGDLSHATVFISFLDSYNETEVRPAGNRRRGTGRKIGGGAFAVLAEAFQSVLHIKKPVFFCRRSKFGTGKDG